MKQTVQLNFLTFPVWWYVIGLPLLLDWCKRSFQYSVKRSGFRLFLRYMNAPLYGDYTRSGRIISFLLRVVLLFGKVAWLGIKWIGLAIVVLVYISILPVSVLMAIYSLIPFSLF